MLVHEQFRRCVAFLRVDALNEKTGEPRRVPVGTAWFVGWPNSNGNARVPYVVTTAHTVIGARAARRSLHLRIPLKNGTHFPLEVSPDDWTLHPLSDVAATPIRLPRNYDIKWLEPSALMSREGIEADHVGLVTSCSL